MYRESEDSPKYALWVQAPVFQHLLLSSFVVGALMSGKDQFILEPRVFLYLSSDSHLLSLTFTKAHFFFPL